MQHLTVKPLFVFGLSFAVLLLIPLWAGLGLFGGEGGGHAEGGHGEGGPSMDGMAGMDSATHEFIENVQAFAANNTGDDGCVRPATEMDEKEHQEAEDHQGEADHAEEKETEENHAEEGHAEEDAAPVVYLRALQWAYIPSRLCLEAGVTYEFRMMATDVIHGASIQLGDASKMVRLPPGTEVEQEVTFTEPGKYLLYCSYYCGVGHQVMKGQITVEPGTEHGDEHEEDHSQEGGH